MDDMTVLVGYGLYEQDNIIAELKRNDIDALAVNCAFPRDRYVEIGDRIVPGVIGGKTNWVGQGGYFRISGSDALCSDRVLISPYGSEGYQRGIVNFLKKELAKEYQGLNLKIMPTGYYLRGHQVHPHLDMYCLYSRQDNLFLVDMWDASRNNLSSLYANGYCRRRIEKIAQELGMADEIWYDGREDDVWWPLNVSVIPAKGKSLFIMDKDSSRLKMILDKKNIAHIDFDGENESVPSGKFSCITNMAKSANLDEALRLVGGIAKQD